MADTKVCMLAGETGAKEYSLLEKYARQGCKIAIMDKDKQRGQMIKEELEKVYQTVVFFFHGDCMKEEDRDIFMATVEEMFGKADYIICQND